MIYDFHSHFLPNVDDGAKDLAMTEKMLDLCKRDEVTDIVSTSHCYPYSEKDIDEFLRKRDEAFARVKGACDGVALHKGCEVHLTGDLMRFSNIKSLCIENTSYMLVEMPTSLWTEETVENVYKLTISGIMPVIAHDERNFKQKRELRDMLYDMDVLIQVNGPSLSMPVFKKEVERLFRMGMVHVIGSDMHNLTTRPPCMGNTKKIIKKRYGADCWEYLMGNAERIMKGDRISYRDFKSYKKKILF